MTPPPPPPPPPATAPRVGMIKSQLSQRTLPTQTSPRLLQTQPSQRNLGGRGQGGQGGSALLKTQSSQRSLCMSTSLRSQTSQGSLTAAGSPVVPTRQMISLSRSSSLPLNIRENVDSHHHYHGTTNTATAICRHYYYYIALTVFVILGHFATQSLWKIPIDTTNLILRANDGTGMAKINEGTSSIKRNHHNNIRTKISTTTIEEEQEDEEEEEEQTNYPKIFRKTSGNGWKIWHNSDVPLKPVIQQQQSVSSTTTITTNSGESNNNNSKNNNNNNNEWVCHWAKYRPFIRTGKQQQSHISSVTRNGETFYINNNDNSNNNNNNIIKYNVSMCTHDPNSEDIWVSKELRTHGRWMDCDSLTYWYDESNNNVSSSTDNHHHEHHDYYNEGWYIDIGANIGSCVMQILLTTNANIAAFEPDPRNLFHFTSTLSQLPIELRRRVYVFPIALGESTEMSEIYVATENRGNAIVGRTIQDLVNPDQTFLDPIPVPVERMDDVLSVDVDDNIDNNDNDNNANQNCTIHLIKMDAQGYECNIIRGMPELLEAASTVVFELEKVMLRSFPNCSEEVLWNTFAGDDDDDDDDREGSDHDHTNNSNDDDDDDNKHQRREITSSMTNVTTSGRRKGKWDIYNNLLSKRGIPTTGLTQLKRVPVAKEGVNLVARRRQRRRQIP